MEHGNAMHAGPALAPRLMATVMAPPGASDQYARTAGARTAPEQAGIALAVAVKVNP